MERDALSRPGRGVESAYERVLLGVAIVVTTVWAIANTAQVIVAIAAPGRSPFVDASLNVIMGTVATGLFGGAVVSGLRRRGNGNGNGVDLGRAIEEELRRKERSDDD